MHVSDLIFVQVDFMKKGKVVFTGDVIVGIVGVFTGISRKGGFSISINERNLGGQPIKDGIDGLLKKSQCPSHLAREVCTQNTTLSIQWNPSISDTFQTHDYRGGLISRG